MKIEVWTDIMCPYCYIGKLHFEKALRQFNHADEVEIRWKAFQLNPSLPGNGKGYSVVEYLKNDAEMSEENIERMMVSFDALAAGAGVSNNLRNAVAANTRDAHRLIKMAAEKGADSAVLLILGKAYFEEAKDYSDHELLTAVGKDAGLNEDDVRSMLNSDRYVAEVEQDIREAEELHIDTVPTFLFDRSQTIIGSEPVEVFLETLNRAYDATEGDAPKTHKGRSCSADGVCEI